MNSVTSIIHILASTYGATPMFRAFGSNPFQFLVAVMLSARSRDSMTIPVAQTLFARAPTPSTLLLLSPDEIERILRPIGFYRVKTRYLIGLCHRLVDVYSGRVPSTLEDLVTFPGVSRKVANVVLGELFHQDVIAVDIHVHRISNRLGWVHTCTPQETESALMTRLPRSTWRSINAQLVQHGQTVCLPRHPRCDGCLLSPYCPKIGVML